MKIRRIGQKKTVMSNEKGSRPYFAWPTVARLQDGRILVGASGYRVEHICPFGKGVIAFSNDEGESYGEIIPVIDTVLDDRDVGLTVFGDKGLIVTSFNNTLEFQRENMPQTKECFDYINSVSPEEEKEALGITFRISRDMGKSFGKIYKSPVSSPHGPIVLRDGRIMWIGRRLGEHNRIEAHTIDTDTGEMTFIGDMEIYKYEDFDGIYFYEPDAIELSDGKLLCHLRAESNNDDFLTLYQTESLDGGVTWSKPKQIIADTDGAPSHLFMHSSGVLISAFSHRQRPYGIWAILSRDEGKTWSNEIVIADGFDSDDLGYPSTVELDNGELLTVYYARDNEDVPAVIMQQKWALEEE